MFIQMRDKKGVSVMIGYILLITFAVVIAIVVAQWLKTYVPSEGLKCPDGVSLYISNYTNESNENLTLTLVNNGNFNIGGIFIHYSNGSEQDIARYDLSEKLIEEQTGIVRSFPGIFFVEGDNDNPFKTGEEEEIKFNVTGINYIYAIEITPRRQQEQKNKIFWVSCGDAGTKKILDLNITA